MSKGLFYTSFSLWWVYARLLHSLLNWFPPSFGKRFGFSLRESTADKIHCSEVSGSAILSAVALVKEHLKANLDCLLDFFCRIFWCVMFLCMEKKKFNWILWVMSFDWAFKGCGGVFIDLQGNNKAWSFSIHHVLNASFFSFHELRNYFFNRIFGRNWHHSFPTLKTVEINLFRWNFLLCSVVWRGPLQFALRSAPCQFYG